MNQRYAAVVLSFFVCACDAGEQSKPTNTTTTNTTIRGTGGSAQPEKPKPPATKQAVPSIASVRLAQNCPDPVTAPAPKHDPKPMKSMKPQPGAKADMAAPVAEPRRSMTQPKLKAKRARGSGPFRQPCTQSTIQFAFAGKGAPAAKVVVKEVRLLSADKKTNLGPLQVRMPTVWKDSRYHAWDGMLAGDTDHKVSYKMSVPNWSDVQQKLSGSTYTMYVLEVDIEIGGQSSTIVSPSFERSRPMMIKT